MASSRTALLLIAAFARLQNVRQLAQTKRVGAGNYRIRPEPRRSEGIDRTAERIPRALRDLIQVLVCANGLEGCISGLLSCPMSKLPRSTNVFRG